VILTSHGEKILFKETYLLARLGDGAPSNAKWTAEEREIIQEVKWWSLTDLKSTHEIVFPGGLADLLLPIVHGKYPEPILVIT